MGSMAMTPEEIEQKMDELARKYVETHNDPSKGWGRKKSHKTAIRALSLELEKLDKQSKFSN
jgi:hypothetical protein